MSRADPAPRAIIAEDEDVLREQLRERLSALWPELEIVAEVEDGVAALRALEADTPDILFLDIQMPGLSGLEVAHQASGRCHVVFVTAYDKYAIAAFEEGAVDYVLKPFSPATAGHDDCAAQAADGWRAGQAGALAAKARRGLEHRARSSALDHRVAGQRRASDHRRRGRLFPRGQQVHAGGHRRMRRPSSASRSRNLPTSSIPNLFWQIHRGTLVNVSAIAGVHRDFKGHLRVRLKNRKETLAVSEPYTHRFKHM